MLRLSVRSARSGRLLVRIVEREGALFVLDFGDPDMMSDATSRIAHGFTLWRMGELLHAVPGDPRFLNLLAEYYASEGLLVAVEEPNWPGRDEPIDDLGDEDAPTEVVPKSR